MWKWIVAEMVLNCYALLNKKEDTRLDHGGGMYK